MLFRIAKDWLHCSIAEIYQRYTSLEIAEMIACYREEPWGFPVDNFRFGMIPAMAVNLTPRKKGAKPAKPDDFYPVTEKPQRPMRRRRG